MISSRNDRISFLKAENKLEFGILLEYVISLVYLPNVVEWKILKKDQVSRKSNLQLIICKFDFIW